MYNHTNNQNYTYDEYAFVNWIIYSELKLQGHSGEWLVWEILFNKIYDDLTKCLS